jgi:hypothetical protein
MCTHNNWYFFPFFVFYSPLGKVRIGSNWGFGFKWFSHPVIFLYSSFDSEFSLGRLPSGCRLGKPNHLNLCVVCNCLIFVIPHSSYFCISWVLGNKINFLTTGIKAFGSSGSDGKRRRKDRNQEVRRHRFRILEDID